MLQYTNFFMVLYFTKTTFDVKTVMKQGQTVHKMQNATFWDIYICEDINPDPQTLPNGLLLRTLLLLPSGPLLRILFNSRTIRENLINRAGQQIVHL